MDLDARRCEEQVVVLLWAIFVIWIGDARADDRGKRLEKRGEDAQQGRGKARCGWPGINDSHTRGLRPAIGRDRLHAVVPENGQAPRRSWC